MRVLVSINHPAHVHKLKNLIWELKRRNHVVKIAAVDKEVCIYLLKKYGFEYEIVGSYRKSILGKIKEMLRIDWNLYKAARKFKPDILVGVGSVYSAHVGWLLRKPNISFEDFEPSKEQYYLYAPFVTKVVTCAGFRRNLGKKQEKVNSFYPLAYLSPKYYRPGPRVVKEKYVVVRFVAWGASHDVGQKGFGDLQLVINKLSEYRKVYISSEKKLPKELVKYKIPVNPEKIFDLLYHADLFIGESASMAGEAAVLGTPSILVSTLVAGTSERLANRYGLMFIYEDEKMALDKAVELLQKESKSKWKEKLDYLFRDTIDFTEAMVKVIERFKKKL